MIAYQTCNAVTAEYSTGVELEYSDNSLLTNDNELDDVRQVIMLGFSLEEKSSYIDTEISSLIEYDDYRNDTFDDEFLGYLNAESTFTIRPSSFYWVIEDYYSQVQRDSLLPTTPDNRINTNVFSTGPNFKFNVGPANYIDTEIRYADYKFDDRNAADTADNDSDRTSVLFSWVYGLNSTTDISLNSEYQDVDFKEFTDSDFIRNDLYIRYKKTLGRSYYQIDLGGSNFKKEVGESLDGFLGRIVLRNQFRQQSYFQLDASSQYTDTSQDLINQAQQNQQLELVENRLSGELFYDVRIEPVYHLGTSVNSYEIQGLYREEDYDVILQDRRSKGLRLNYGYTHSADFSLNSYLQYREYNYTDILQIDKETVFSISSNKRISRDFSFILEYSYVEQDSNVETAKYDNNRILFSFFYGRSPRSYR
ncbi:MAG: hypothetical protein OQK98_06085 [Gammaproteobacteria bacterium]|nr:hypothetical protein [Gammaproteobacteria bacterium]